MSGDKEAMEQHKAIAARKKLQGQSYSPLKSNRDLQNEADKGTPEFNMEKQENFAAQAQPSKEEEKAKRVTTPSSQGNKRGIFGKKR